MTALHLLQRLGKAKTISQMQTMHSLTIMLQSEEPKQKGRGKGSRGGATSSKSTRGASKSARGASKAPRGRGRGAARESPPPPAAQHNNNYTNQSFVQPPQQPGFGYDRLNGYNPGPLYPPAPPPPQQHQQYHYQQPPCIVHHLLRSVTTQIKMNISLLPLSHSMSRVRGRWEVIRPRNSIAPGELEGGDVDDEGFDEGGDFAWDDDVDWGAVELDVKMEMDGCMGVGGDGDEEDRVSEMLMDSGDDAGVK
ncbi:hypothetical protein BCR33DRAFT_369297 [Rhizoclosmatium globosum]|uniref:Uncharacterized protein n=1 Tax=Rhizoclosmatium globosum TaxID=329046 RepID=A0A1Y2BZ91_9FUNG|nr:hypothetical protein BCR33DRAFT_369297 [Rhizoclosmatium globosum]|eukprot:ORY40081.1 hypothetical protein BCR33DRAFT_369297 [Rhizoclosmatium globosum]